MKKIFATTIAILFAININAQDNCFSKCKENLEKSTLPWPETNDQVIQNLIGCKAPEFNVKTIDGEVLNLSELKGKVVVLNFWFETCAPCVAELPALNQLTEDYKTKDVVFIGFGRDDSESIKNFVKNRKFNFKLVSSSFDFAEDYCIINGWPTNMVLDKNGIVRQIFSGGFIDERAKTAARDKMKPAIDKFLTN